MTIAILVVAAGTGQRAGAGSVPKQYQKLGEQQVIAHTVSAFARTRRADTIQVVIHPDHDRLYNTAFPVQEPWLMPPVRGGTSRQCSVFRGLRALESVHPDHVLIHDAARPFITPEIINNTIDALQNTDSQAVLTAIPVTDTIKQVQDGQVKGTLDRSTLMAAQTPQGFGFDLILQLHERAARECPDTFTDDISLAEWQGIPVRIVQGSPDNFKLTTQQDLQLARQIQGRKP